MVHFPFSNWITKIEFIISFPFFVLERKTKSKFVFRFFDFRFQTEIEWTEGTRTWIIIDSRQVVNKSNSRTFACVFKVNLISKKAFYWHVYWHVRTYIRPHMLNTWQHQQEEVEARPRDGQTALVIVPNMKLIPWLIYQYNKTILNKKYMYLRIRSTEYKMLCTQHIIFK